MLQIDHQRGHHVQIKDAVNWFGFLPEKTKG